MPELSNEKVYLEKGNDSEVKSTLLEILRNEVDPEEIKIQLDNTNKNEDLSEKRVYLDLEKDADPEEKRISLENKREEIILSEKRIELEGEKDRELLFEINHTLQENQIDPDTNVETIPKTKNEGWLKDNYNYDVSIPQQEKHKIIIAGDLSSTEITTWDDSKYERISSSNILNSQFDHFKEILGDNAVESGYTTWGINASSFDVEHDSSEDLYTRRDLGDNNLIKTKDSEFLRNEVSEQTILEKNKLPKRTKEEQNSLHNNEKVTSWKTLSSKESDGFDYEHSSEKEDNYFRNWIGDNNLKDEVNIPQFESHKKVVESNVVNSGYTTWGIDNSLFDFEKLKVQLCILLYYQHNLNIFLYLNHLLIL